MQDIASNRRFIAPECPRDGLESDVGLGRDTQLQCLQLSRHASPDMGDVARSIPALARVEIRAQLVPSDLAVRRRFYGEDPLGGDALPPPLVNGLRGDTDGLR